MDSWCFGDGSEESSLPMPTVCLGYMLLIFNMHEISAALIMHTCTSDART